jgi:ERCC4-type nuclease
MQAGADWITCQEPIWAGGGRVNTIQPTIVIDTREQTPLTFANLPSERGTLQSGDYSARGLEELFAVERKSIADLVACCTVERERFERELHRLRGFRFARLLIVGCEAEITTHRYRGNTSPKSVLHTALDRTVRLLVRSRACTRFPDAHQTDPTPGKGIFYQ